MFHNFPSRKPHPHLSDSKENTEPNTYRTSPKSKFSKFLEEAAHSSRSFADSDNLSFDDRGNNEKDFGCSGYFGSGSGHKNPPPLKSLSNIEADGQHLVISSEDQDFPDEEEENINEGEDELEELDEPEYYEEREEPEEPERGSIEPQRSERIESLSANREDEDGIEIEPPLQIEQKIKPHENQEAPHVTDRQSEPFEEDNNEPFYSDEEKEQNIEEPTKLSKENSPENVISDEENYEPNYDDDEQEVQNEIEKHIKEPSRDQFEPEEDQDDEPFYDEIEQPRESKEAKLSQENIVSDDEEGYEPNYDDDEKEQEVIQPKQTKLSQENLISDEENYEPNYDDEDQEAKNELKEISQEENNEPFYGDNDEIEQPIESKEAKLSQENIVSDDEKGYEPNYDDEEKEKEQEVIEPKEAQLAQENILSDEDNYEPNYDDEEKEQEVIEPKETKLSQENLVSDEENCEPNYDKEIHHETKEPSHHEVELEEQFDKNQATAESKPAQFSQENVISDEENYDEPCYDNDEDQPEIRGPSSDQLDLEENHEPFYDDDIEQQQPIDSRGVKLSHKSSSLGEPIQEEPEHEDQSDFMEEDENNMSIGTPQKEVQLENGVPQSRQETHDVVHQMVDLTNINDILANYHNAFSELKSQYPKEMIPEYELYKLIDQQILHVHSKSPTKDQTQTEEDLTTNETSLKEDFTYLDAKDFYNKDRRVLARTSSCKKISRTKNPEEEISLSRDESFKEFYRRYLVPMREKIEDYAEKINNLVKEKELEFFNMNEIVQRLITDFSKEKQQLEATLRERNIAVANLKEQIENLQNRSQMSERNSARVQSQDNLDHMNMPRQIKRSNTWTPDKLYSFRARASGNKNPQLNSKQKLLQSQQRRGQRNQNSPEENEFMAMNPDLINISQINFETNPDDFSMTNQNLFNDKPTSRFMDYDDIHENQRGSSSRKVRSSKNWATVIKEEETNVSRNENSMISPEFDFIRTMNENLFNKMAQSDNEKSKLMEFVERLVFDKKDSQEKESKALANLQMKEMELKNLQEECQKEREELKEEREMIEEVKEVLRREKEMLIKKKAELKEVVKNIQSKSAKQLAEKDLQLLLMDKKIESKKKVLEDEWTKLDTTKREMKQAQEAISIEWKKINNDVEELERLYSNYEQCKEELAREKREIKGKYELQYREVENKKKELMEYEKRLKIEKRGLNKQEDRLAREREELEGIERDLKERGKMLALERQQLEKDKTKHDVKLGTIDAKLRGVVNRIRRNSSVEGREFE